MNRENLRFKVKFQNQVSEYKDLVAHCHTLGITCHAGYILGLPFDTPKSRIEEGLSELIKRTTQGVVDWRELKGKELVRYYKKSQAEIPEVKIPSAVRLWLRKRNPFAEAFSRAYIRRIWQRWYMYLWNPLKWTEVWLFECINGLRFLFHLLGVGPVEEQTSIPISIRIEE